MTDYTVNIIKPSVNNLCVRGRRGVENLLACAGS
jgi:hypothetical protein